MTDIPATRAFFGPRAAGWEDRFPDDAPAYQRAVAEMTLSPGASVVDVGCGTGRALPPLWDAVGPGGVVIGVDVTVEMLTEAARRGRAALATLILADAMTLPFATGAFDAVFAAGLVSHLSDPIAGLAELARVCRRGGRLALFHPVGRVALARRRGHDVDPGDIRAPHRISAALAEAGWHSASVDDADDRYLVLATR